MPVVLAPRACNSEVKEEGKIIDEPKEKKDEAPGVPERAKKKREPKPALCHYYDHFPRHPGCEECARANAQFPGHFKVPDGEREVATTTGERLFGDLCTPWPTAPRGESTLFVVGDEHSGMVFGFPLLGKIPGAVRQSLLKVRRWLKDFRMESKENDPIPWFFKSDQGGEFVDCDLRDWLSDLHGEWETVPTGRHVAGAERLVRTFAEGVRAAVSGSGLPANYWAFAVPLYFWNKNLLNGHWHAMCVRRKLPTERRVFGQLCFCKLEDNAAGANKAEDSGRPCAFLGWSLASRFGAFVLFLDSEGNYCTTMVDRRGLRWPEENANGPPPMAFYGRFNDLRTLSVPGEEMGVEVPLAEGVNDSGVGEMSPAKAPVIGKKGKVQTHWTNPTSTCPACRGRSRAHTYKGRGANKCRWSGLTRQRLEQSRSKAAEMKVSRATADVIIAAAAGMMREGGTWENVSRWYVEQLEGSKREHAAKVEERECVAAAAHASSQSSLETAMDRLMRATQHEFNLGHQDEQHPFAFVTRNMTAMERASPEGQAALQKEVDKTVGRSRACLL